MAPPELHPDLAPLAFLVGDWVGEGRGDFPTIAPFSWTERTSYRHVGKPVLIYEQRTRDAITGEPRHAESGYLRPGAELGTVEFVVAHSTGHLEMAEGTVADGRVVLETTAVLGTPTAKDVAALKRTIDLDGDTLRVNLAMAAVGEPMTEHLTAELTRAPT